MNNKLREVMAYLLSRYPHAHEMSNARVTKMVYLADWKHAIDQGRPISGVEWVFNNYGPFVWDIKDIAESNPAIFRLERAANLYGTPKLLVRLANPAYEPNLDATEKAAIDHVVEATKPLNYQDFIRLVYSTYPILRCSRFSTLDLVQLASEYNATVRRHGLAPVQE